MSYLDLLEVQQFAHHAVQENNLELHTGFWKIFFPFYFPMDKTKYARYGSYYVAFIVGMELLYLGLKDLLGKKRMSVKPHEIVPLRIAIDQRVEQTLSRDAKATGGMTSFASDKSAILEWPLNLAEHAKSTDCSPMLAN